MHIDRMFWIAFYAKLWVYPVLEVLGWTERLLFLVACWLLMIGCYFVGEFLTSILWRKCYFHVLWRKCYFQCQCSFQSGCGGTLVVISAYCCVFDIELDKVYLRH